MLLFIPISFFGVILCVIPVFLDPSLFVITYYKEISTTRKYEMVFRAYILYCESCFDIIVIACYMHFSDVHITVLSSIVLFIGLS